MARIQVYLPDALAREVKRRKLSPSAVLQEALRLEFRRREQLSRLDDYIDELREEVGDPKPPERARAGSLVRRLAGRSARQAS
jgi:hypothetical protein